MKTLVIEVRGGVVQHVYADEGTRVIVVDWDHGSSPEECVAELPAYSLNLMPEHAEQFLGIA